MPGVKGKSGRKKKTEETRTVVEILHGVAPHAAKYLRDVIKGTVKRPSWARIEVCRFIIDHELGKPRIKVELPGAGGTPLTWQAVILLAQQAEKEGEIPKFIGNVPLITQEATKPPKDRASGEAEPEDNT